MRRLIIYFFSISLGILLQQAGLSQSKTINGTVVTVSNAPVNGASVLLRGTGTGTQTDADGKFSISASVGQVLEISSVGYQTQNITVGNETSLRVVLAEENQTLQDVVIVGYGTQKRGDLTGAISTVDVGKTLTARPIADVGRGLQGATSGLNVTIPSGEVGSDPVMTIRAPSLHLRERVPRLFYLITWRYRAFRSSTRMISSPFPS